MRQRRKFSPSESLREAIQDMKPLDALEHVLQAYEAVTGTADEEVRVREWLRCGPCEARIFMRLDRAPGAVVPREALIATMDAGKILRRASSSDSLNVQISTLRRRLPEGYAIRNVNSVGYALERVE